MDKFTSWEAQGLKEFFQCPEITDLVIPVAKIVSKNLLNPQTNSGKHVQILEHTIWTGIVLKFSSNQ